MGVDKFLEINLSIAKRLRIYCPHNNDGTHWVNRRWREMQNKAFHD